MFRLVLRLDGALEAIAAVQRLSATLQSGREIQALGRQLTREALRTVQILTPVQVHERSAFNPKTKRGFPALSGRWRATVEQGSGTRYAATIYNLASRNKAGLAVLIALEQGAGPHKIAARVRRGRRGRLAWNEPGVISLFGGRFRDTKGRTHDRFKVRFGRGPVIVESVNHPGNRPFRMVARTEYQLEHVVLPRLAADLQQRLVEQFARGSIVPRGGTGFVSNVPG